MLKEVERRMKEQGIELKIEKSVKKLVAEKGIDKSYGARPLRRAIQNIVEDSLAEYILDGKIKAGEEVKIAAKDRKNNCKININIIKIVKYIVFYTLVVSIFYLKNKEDCSKSHSAENCSFGRLRGISKQIYLLCYKK